MEENLITLINEAGEEEEFEIVLTLEAQGNEYAILLPVDDEDCDEALVFRIDSDEEGDLLLPIEDEEEYQNVVAAYEVIAEQMENDKF